MPKISRRINWASKVATFPLLILGVLLLFFLAGGLIPGPIRAGIEQRLSLPFSVPPVAHVVLCSVISASLRWWRPTWYALAVLAGVLVIGGVTEVAQHWIPHRTPNWSDMGLNLAGGLLGLLAMSVSQWQGIWTPPQCKR